MALAKAARVQVRQSKVIVAVVVSLTQQLMGALSFCVSVLEASLADLERLAGYFGSTHHGLALLVRQALSNEKAPLFFERGRRDVGLKLLSDVYPVQLNILSLRLFDRLKS